MKKVKYLILSVIVALSSCTNNDSIIEEINSQESASLLRVVSHIKTNSDANETNLNRGLSFSFLYETSFIYNNGALVEVSDFSELTAIIARATPELFLQGIEFPFNVKMNGNPESKVINNEIEFASIVSISSFNDCDCPADYDPVCIMVNGAVVEYDNQCLAECDGYTEFVDCNGNGCGCPTDYDPVCVMTVNGSIVEYDNQCLAECDGYTEFVDCNGNGCGCPTDYDPVCVMTVNGSIVEYDNQCLAECDGYTEFVDCNGNGCGCPTDYDPVCVMTVNGPIVEYDNQCLAECDGYTEFVDCNSNCYDYNFPINMTSNSGNQVMANSNQEVDDYLALGYVLVYPIELIINNEIIIVQQGILEGAYGPRCN